MLKIVTYPNKILRKTARRVTEFNQELKQLAESMAETMTQAEGVGLAAVQVNQDRDLFVMRLKKDEYKVFVNPDITFYSVQTQTGEEGCLSLPGVYAVVKRAKKIHLKYQNLNGKVIKEKIKGFDAVVIQHEFDHLRGVLFIDRAEKIINGQEILAAMQEQSDERK